MDWMLTLLFIVGLMVGSILTKLIFLKKDTTGDLVIVDDGFEDRPYIFLNINHEDLEALQNNNIIKLSVDRKKSRKKNHDYYGTGDFVTERRDIYGRKS